MILVELNVCCYEIGTHTLIKRLIDMLYKTLKNKILQFGTLSAKGFETEF